MSDEKTSETVMWYETLDPQKREILFAWMRKTNEKVDADFRRSHSLEAPMGSISVGSAAFDPFLGGEAAREFLCRLRGGATPDVALEFAKSHARSCVVTHNAKRPRDTNWARWEGTADLGLETLHRSLLRVLEQVSA